MRQLLRTLVQQGGSRAPVKIEPPKNRLPILANFSTAVLSNFERNSSLYASLEKPKVPYFLPFVNRLPEKAARYEIGRSIGQGNFAVVHEAKDKETNELVAIKIMDKASTPRELCRQELKILKQIHEEVGHSRLTPIKDVFETDDRLFIVLELIRGGDFYDHMIENGNLSEHDAAVVIRKLIYALEALHRHDIIHRDIKLENILLFPRKNEKEGSLSEFKIADFGYAKHVHEEDKFANYAGTIGYAAPEVLEHRQYGTACDVWSAGVVLYILLAGYPPFPHKEENCGRQLSTEELIEVELEAIYYGRQKDNWNRQFNHEPWNEISLDAKRLVSGMLRIDPKTRYTTSVVLNDPWIKRATNMQQQEYLNFE